LGEQFRTSFGWMGRIPGHTWEHIQDLGGVQERSADTHWFSYR